MSCCIFRQSNPSCIASSSQIVLSVPSINHGGVLGLIVYTTGHRKRGQIYETSQSWPHRAELSQPTWYVCKIISTIQKMNTYTQRDNLSSHVENEAVCQQPVIQPAHLQTLTHTPACRHTRFPSAITLVLGCSQLYLSIYLSRFPQACMPLPLSPLSHNSRYTRSFRSRGYTCTCAFSVGLCGGGYIYAFYTHSVTL